MEKAIEGGDAEKVSELLAGGIDVNARYADGGNTALHLAVLLDKVDVARTLLNAGADINAKRTDGMTALLLAALLGKAQTVRLLVDSGADIGVTANGADPLYKAAALGHSPVLQVLVDAGADVNAKQQGGGSALEVAAVNGHTRVVRALIAGGADVNARNESGSTALMLAAASGRVDVVQALIDAGADSNASSNDVSALMVATREGHAGVVRLLNATRAMQDGKEGIKPLPRRELAASYRPAVTTWDQFVADGWTTRTLGSGDLGIIRLSGQLGGTLEIVLGVVMDGKVGFVVNPPEAALPLALEAMESGLGADFEAGYFDSEPIQLPSGARMGGKLMTEPVCQLRFESRVLADNGCAP